MSTYAPSVVAVLGSTGFIGKAVVGRLRSANLVVRTIPGPRILWASAHPPAAAQFEDVVSRLVDELDGAQVVINAAGLAQPGGKMSEALIGANSALPSLVSTAANRAKVGKFIHISSAAVQGRGVLDESDRVSPFSAYSQTKVWGETWLDRTGSSAVTALRPTSVHGPRRSVTRSLARLAASPLSSVAGPGNAPTPQVLVEDVAEAVFNLVTSHESPPIALQPWGGLTVSALFEALGSRSPVRIPPLIAKTVCHGLAEAGRVHASAASQARRLEMLWFGQAQTRTWLEDHGWDTSPDLLRWQTLAAECRSEEMTTHV